MSKSILNKLDSDNRMLLTPAEKKFFNPERLKKMLDLIEFMSKR